MITMSLYILFQYIGPIDPVVDDRALQSTEQDRRRSYVALSTSSSTGLAMRAYVIIMVSLYFVSAHCTNRACRIMSYRELGRCRPYRDFISSIYQLRHQVGFLDLKSLCDYNGLVIFCCSTLYRLNPQYHTPQSTSYPAQGDVGQMDLVPSTITSSIGLAIRACTLENETASRCLTSMPAR